MAHLLQVLRARAFAEHLLHGIARNNVREHEHHRDDEPECGNGEQEPQRNVADHFRRRPLTAPAGARFSAASGAATLADAADSEGDGAVSAGSWSALIFTRET